MHCFLCIIINLNIKVLIFKGINFPRWLLQINMNWMKSEDKCQQATFSEVWSPDVHLYRELSGLSFLCPPLVSDLLFLKELFLLNLESSRTWEWCHLLSYRFRDLCSNKATFPCPRLAVPFGWGPPFSIP